MADDQRYGSWLVRSAPAVAKRALGDDVVAHGVTEAFSREVERWRDPAWREGYRQACPVPGASADAYGLRELWLGGDLGLLAGIHFYGGDVAKPFVGIEAQTRDVTVEAMVEATPALLDAFAAFSPRATWWWVQGGDDGSPRPKPVVADQRLLIGSIPELVRAPVERSALPFTLRRDETGASYAEYDRAFSTFVASNPAWEGRLVRSSREDVMACAAAGGLWVVEHGGRFAGVFAARPGEVRGIPGWVVEEMLLGDALRGRGLAPLVQRLALERLDASERPLVMGTIHADNAASLRTARRVGHTDAGGWVFVPEPRRALSW